MYKRQVLQVAAPPPPGAPTAQATVLASKGGYECAAGSLVSVGLYDLQAMQNHMRETIGQGLAEMQARQGTGGLPPLPAAAQAAPQPAAFAVGAPPPDASAVAEVGQQAQAADQAEQQLAAAPLAPDAATAAGGTPTLSLGQSSAQIVALQGQPTRVVDLGAKKIYIYPDLKITFQNDRVVDIK